MTSSRHTLVGALACSLHVLAAAAPAQIEDLGSNHYDLAAFIAAISSDGAVILGNQVRNASSSDTEAFRWTRDGGIEVLGTLNGASSRAVDISGDGSYATGTVSTYRGVRWGPDGVALDLGTIPGGSDNTYPSCITGDGQTVAGSTGLASGGGLRAFVWQESTGMVDLHPSVGGYSSFASYVSTDGSAVVGEFRNGTSPGGTKIPFVWTASGGAIPITVPGINRLDLLDASDDCSVVLCMVHTGSGFPLARWTAATGAVFISPNTPGPGSSGSVSSDGSTIFGRTIDGAFIYTEADGYQVVAPPGHRFREGSADGSVLYGYRLNSSSTESRPFRWTAAAGFEDLASASDYSSGANTLQGVSADGTIAVGASRRADDVVRAVRWPADGRIGSSYCSPAVPNSASPSGASLTLGGSNLAEQGELSLNASNLPPGAFGFFLISTDRDVAVQAGGSQGTLCLGSSIGRFVGPGQIQQAGADGRMSLTIDPGTLPSPTGPIVPHFGGTWNFQAWYRDANPGLTSNFTNGASVTLY